MVQHESDLAKLAVKVIDSAKSSPWLAALIAVAAVFVIPYFTNTWIINVPGPLPAKFTDLWLAWQASGGHRFEIVHELHKEHGKFVRLGPNHVSINDPAALNAVYGHSTGTLKSDYYDAFVPPRPFPRGLFNTRDRAEHSRKRKIVSHTFAPKTIVAFEPFIRREAQLLVERWDTLCASAKETGKDGRAWIDVLCWLNYWAFDTIGDLAFGTPFGMLEAGEDKARIEMDGKVGYVSAINTINERGEYSSTMGLVPVYLRGLAGRIPWFSKRLKSVKALTGIAVARVNDRLVNGSDREDLLAKLQGAKDDQGEPLGKMELTAEALTQLVSRVMARKTISQVLTLNESPKIAGSDTTSNTSTAIMHHLVTHPQALKKLQQELDSNLSHSEEVPLAGDVEELPYLSAVISESLRYHSTSALGLPRIVPPGGANIAGKFFPGGCIVSVPAYSIHRNVEVYGKDAEEYNPDRWLAPDARKRFERAFVPFSVGPRACVGRNVALMELNIIVATIVRRYDLKLKEPDAEFETFEGFLRKPLKLDAGIRRRE